ncbi:hypothetical protein QFC21_005518 [Naganishia friedmannii]|uniref:Uncharacterized protein n=1 Tax=Naganishia friedmannii TaxID=89922 RepID=A0ACC2V9A1_9TREE|nr:hypothetical protein QFC21_005518 [Naganishia friedmannii]
MSSAPASSVYSNDAQTLAPSEASLNRRWYTQIQQWTHRLPPDTDEQDVKSTEEETPREREVLQRSRRGRDDEGTEAGTVAPGHSISRRASREYMKVSHGEQQRSSVVVKAEKLKTSSPSTRRPESTVHPTSRKAKLIKYEHGERPVCISEQQPPSLHEQRRQPTIIASPREKEALQTPQPKRGRRPPTPYHPPSDLALSEVLEEEEESVIAVEEAMSAKERGMNRRDHDVPTRTTTRNPSLAASTTTRKRYPPPPPSTVTRAQTVKQRPSSKIAPSRKSLRDTDAITTTTITRKAVRSVSSPAETSTTIVLPIAASSTAVRNSRSNNAEYTSTTITATDDASFPPFSSHQVEEMTVVPEDSISHVGINMNRPLPPPPRAVRSRRSPEAVRGRSEERITDQGRRERALTSSSDGDTTEHSRSRGSSSSDTDSTLSVKSGKRRLGPAYRRIVRDSSAWSSSSPPFPGPRRPIGGPRTTTGMSYEFPPAPDPRMASHQPILRLTSPPPPPPQISYHPMHPILPPPPSRQLSAMHAPLLLPSSGSIGQLIGQQNNQQMMMYGNTHWLPPHSSLPHNIHGPTNGYTAPPIAHAQGYAGGITYPDRRRAGTSPLPNPNIRRGSLGLMSLLPMAAVQQGQQGAGLDRMMSRRPSRATSLPVQGLQKRAGGERRLERQRTGIPPSTPQVAGGAPEIRSRRADRGRSTVPILPGSLARMAVPGARNATPRRGGNVGLVSNMNGRGNEAAMPSQNARNIPIGQRVPVVRQGTGVVGATIRRGGGMSGRTFGRAAAGGRTAGARSGPIVSRPSGNVSRSAANPKGANVAAAGNGGGGGWVKGLLPPYGRKT